MLDGNLVMASAPASSCPRDMVFAAIEGQLVLKCLRQQPDGRVLVQAAHPGISDILAARELAVLGVGRPVTLI